MILLQPPIGERRRSARDAQEQRLQMRTRQPRRREVPTQPNFFRNIGKIQQFSLVQGGTHTAEVSRYDSLPIFPPAVERAALGGDPVVHLRLGVKSERDAAAAEAA